MKGRPMKKVLIADDSLFMRRVLKDILSEKYAIVEADSGSSALAQFEKEKPHVVLLDIVMPEGEEEGLRVLRTIMKTHPKTNVIMITAVGQESTIELCRELGAKDYVLKPFDEGQVIETVERY